MAEAPVIEVKNYREYYRFVLSFITTIYNKQKLAPKEEDYMTILLFCYAHGIPFFSKEFKSVFKADNWNESHLYTYRGTLINKKWLEYAEDGETLRFVHPPEGMLVTQDSLTIAFKVKILDTSMMIVG